MLWQVGASAGESDVVGIKYWDKMLPGAAMPPSLRASLSPLDGSPAQAQLFAMRIKQAASFDPATSAALCKAAGLVCNPVRGPTTCIGQFALLGRASESNSDQAARVDEGFFLESDLVEEATTHLHGEHGPALHRAFLPKAVADAMPPLTSDNLPNLQQIFNIQGGTNMSAAMKEAVSFCEDAARLPGEKRACPTSLESMVDFVASSVGRDVAVLEQEKAVEGPAKLVSFTQRSLPQKDSALCHNVGFPSQLYSCHVVPDTKVVEASVMAADGSATRAVGVCHMATKTWDPRYEGFTILKARPGTPVCHWVEPGALIWVATKY